MEKRRPSDVIKDMRKRLGLSQRDLAAQIGFHHSYVGHFESNRVVERSSFYYACRHHLNELEKAEVVVIEAQILRDMLRAE